MTTGGSRAYEGSGRIERFLAELTRDPAIERLAEMAWESAGNGLTLLLPAGENVVHIHPLGKAGCVPAFCRLVQESERGRRRCSICRSLASVRATARGSGINTCHGGISTYSAPAGTVETHKDLFAIVSTCAYRLPPEPRHWNAARKNLRGLLISSRALRKAYLELPVLTPKRQQIIASIVETAAAVVSSIALRCCGGLAADSRRPMSEQELHDALRNAREEMTHEEPTRRGALIVDTVAAILKRNAGARISVKALSTAAGLTPNYFSALFRKHAGKRFVDFLVDARISLAQELLHHPALRVKEVARRCGFDDAAYFARRFRQQTGQAPEVWRNAHHRIPHPSGPQALAMRP